MIIILRACFPLLSLQGLIGAKGERGPRGNPGPKVRNLYIIFLHIRSTHTIYSILVGNQLANEHTIQTHTTYI